MYRVLLGRFSDARPTPRLCAEKLAAPGKKRRLVEAGAPRAGRGGRRSDRVTAEDGRAATPCSRRSTSFRPAPTPAFSVDGEAVPREPARRWSIRAGTLNVVNRVDLEEYLYGVVPAEMGPKRYDEIEALKAQAVAARTYALAHRGQFEAEGYDLCATAEVPGLRRARRVEDPLSNGRRRRHARARARLRRPLRRRALRLDVRGPHGERRERLLGEAAVPYLVSVECGELADEALAGRRVGRKTGARPRTRPRVARLRARGVTPREDARAARRGSRPRRSWAGVGGRRASAPLPAPAAVYPSLVAAFDLTEARALHLTPREQSVLRRVPRRPPAD